MRRGAAVPARVGSNAQRWLGTAVLAACFAGAAHANAHRVALVVGIGAYQHLPALPNTVADARLIADKLRATGFEVDLETDLGKDALARAVRDFAHKVEGAGPDAVAAFYYAGHGIQDDRQTNFLLGADADVKSQVDLPFEALPLDRTLETFEAAHPAVTLVMLDACRDNPLPASSRGVKRGLAVEAERRGLLIAFSTEPGKTADDGPAGGDSPFATALASTLDIKGLESAALFKAVTKKVMDATNGEQFPWVTSRLTGDFFFRPAEPGDLTPALSAAVAVTSPPAAATAAPATAKGPSAAEAEVAYGRAVLSNSIEEYEAWLTRYPDSERRASVINLMQRLREEALWKKGMASSASEAISALETELIAYPNGVYADRAKQRLAELKTNASATPSAPDQTFSPSFDCSKAGSPVEGRICASADLEARDRDLAQVFADVLGRSGTPLALQIAESQWVRTRDLCGSHGTVGEIDACIRAAYDQRIASLRQGSTAAAPAPAAVRIAPSFDCAMARSVAEHLICDENDLAAADLRMASLYREALGKGAEHRDLDLMQGQWFASREACASTAERSRAVSCMRDVYQHRIDALASSVGLSGATALATAEPSDSTDLCEAFASQYFAAWSGSGDDPEGYIQSVYAPQVVFYGQLMSREQVLDVKRKFIARWPHRAYSVASMAPPVLGNGRCGLQGVVRWEAQRAGNTSRGSAQFSFTLVMNGTPRIVAESGKVIARSGGSD